MSYTNEELEKVRIKGALEGLDRDLKYKKKYAALPEYKGDMSDEIARIEKEIKKLEKEF